MSSEFNPPPPPDDGPPDAPPFDPPKAPPKPPAPSGGLKLKLPPPKTTAPSSSKSLTEELAAKRQLKATGIAVAPVKVVIAPDDLADVFTNAEHNWLTYEVVFNQRAFRKNHQKHQMGLYRLPRANVRIFIRQFIDDALLQQIADAFFPDLTKEQVVACSDWPWQKRASDAKLPVSTPSVSNSSRDQRIIGLGDFVVMPYNFKDNDANSSAFGTSAQREGYELIKLPSTWDMWNSASRSSVVKIARVKTQGSSIPWPKPEAYTWTWGSGDKSVDFVSEDKKNQQFRISAGANCFSIKTGVRYIGSTKQEGKEHLEANSIIACLRSDLIAEVDKQLGRDSNTDAELLLQTELLAITELNTSDPITPGDGIQVRDISCLKKDCVYLSPISIPFLDLKLTTLRARFSAIDEDGWADFWKKYYAERIGVAKAQLLLRYGLQLNTPNSQNFLLEFTTALKPTGRIVIRDIGDAKLHMEVIWALYGDGSAPPDQGDFDKLATVKNKILQYECDTLRKSSPGTYPFTSGRPSNKPDYPPKTQLHWHQYSTLTKGASVTNRSGVGVDPEAASAGWQKVLNMMADWGLAHNKAYVNYLEQQLGVKVDVKWMEMADPKRFLALEDSDSGAGLANGEWQKDIKQEADIAGKVHDMLRSKEGQDAIRAYRKRVWTPATSSEPTKETPPPMLIVDRRLDTPSGMGAQQLGDSSFLVAAQVTAIDRGKDAVTASVNGNVVQLKASSLPGVDGLKTGDLVQVICHMA